MKALIESKKKPTLLLGDVQQHAVKKAQEETDRRSDVIHPSEMAKEDWCPRQTAYRIRGIQPSNPQKIEGYRMLTIFQEGHDIHSKWQTWLAEMGRLWGTWQCPACGRRTESLGQPLCAHDVAVPMEYREVPLDAEEKWLVAGHSDGGVPDLRAMIEVKSIGLGTVRIEEPALVRQHTVKTEDGKRVVDYDSLWKAIKRPLKGHRKQALVYLAIAHLQGLPFDRMIFIYENKANQDVKEFVISYDSEATEELIDTALDIKYAVEKGRDLPRPVGFTEDKKPCKECPWLTWCWAGEEEDEHADSEPEPDAADGSRVPGGEEEAGPPADLHADTSERRVPRSARRPHRTGRQRPDAGDDPVHEVGRVPERPTGGSGGRRVVRRRVPRPGEGGQGPRELD